MGKEERKRRESGVFLAILRKNKFFSKNIKNFASGGLKFLKNYGILINGIRDFAVFRKSFKPNS